MIDRSSLIYNPSARHEQHECDTSDTNATRATQVRREYYTNDTSVTRVKNFDFYNDIRKTIFLHLYMIRVRLKGEEQFNSKNYLLEMPFSHAKMRLKSAPQKLNFLVAKATSKSYTLDFSCKCSCTFPHSYVQ